MRTGQDEQRCQPTTFSELYVSVEPVANHDGAFGVEIMSTITTRHEMKIISVWRLGHADNCMKQGR
jgi:hypothetical protein